MMKLTDAEWQVMEVLWSGAQFALGDVTNALKTISKTYGITIVMVSHNTDFIKELSNRAIFMDDGKIIDDSEDMDKIVGNFIDFCHADYLKGD